MAQLYLDAELVFPVCDVYVQSGNVKTIFKNPKNTTSIKEENVTVVFCSPQLITNEYAGYIRQYDEVEEFLSYPSNLD